MGRVKLEIKKIENPSSRLATYSKRRNGLLKKAYELSVLCDIDLAVIMFSPSGKLTICSKDGRLEEVLRRYANAPPDERAKGKSENLAFLNKMLQKHIDERGVSSSVPESGHAGAELLPEPSYPDAELPTQNALHQTAYDVGVLPAQEGASNVVSEVQTVAHGTGSQFDNSLGGLQENTPPMLTGQLSESAGAPTTNYYFAWPPLDTMGEDAQFYYEGADFPSCTSFLDGCISGFSEPEKALIPDEIQLWS